MGKTRPIQGGRGRKKVTSHESTSVVAAGADSDSAMSSGNGDPHMTRGMNGDSRPGNSCAKAIDDHEDAGAAGGDMPKFEDLTEDDKVIAEAALGFSEELESLANFVTSNGSGDHVDEANSGQVRQGKPNPTLGEESHFEGKYRVVFTRNGGYTVEEDDTDRVASFFLDEGEREEIQLGIKLARHRLVYESEPPRYLFVPKPDRKANAAKIMEMGAITRLRGLTRLEVAVMRKEINNPEYLEVQDEHKTPGLVSTDNNYADALLDIELQALSTVEEGHENYCLRRKKESNEDDCYCSIKDHLFRALSLRTKVNNVIVEQDKTLRMVSNCQICEKPAPMKCKKCLTVGYCCKEHQTEDWRIHKKKCIPFEIKTNEVLGRHLVARRDLKPGELILKESALVSGPTLGDSVVGNIAFDIKGLVKEEDEEDIQKQVGECTLDEARHLGGKYFYPKCLGCYMSLDKNPLAMDQSVPLCPKCSWPLCSPSCSKIENHEMECEYFSKNCIVYNDLEREYLIVPRVFMIFRCLLLKEKKPEVWKFITSLESHCQLREDWEKDYGARLHDLYLVRIIKSGFKCTADVSLIRAIIGIIDCNAFYGSRLMIEEKRFYSKMKRLVGLFEKASFLSHSCTPNAIVVVSPTNHRIEVIAGRPIFKGDPIYIDYDYTGDLRNRLEHRNFLTCNYFFNCKCTLCSDPTEMGLFLSGIICTKCKRRGRQGVIAPTDPLNMENSWQCRKCGFERTYAAVTKVVADATNMLGSSVGNYEQIVEKVRNSILPPFNTVVMQAELSTVKIFTNEDFQTTCKPDNKSVDFLKTAMRKRLDILELFYPSMDRRIVNCHLAMTGICQLESRNCREIRQVQECIDWGSQKLVDMGILFPCVDSFNQYHAYLLRTIRVAALRLQNIIKKRYKMQEDCYREKLN